MVKPTDITTYLRRISVLMMLQLVIPFCVDAFDASAGLRQGADELVFYGADHRDLRYTGRIDFSNPALPRFWAPGVYVEANFSGTSCEVLINDEMLWGDSHNYVSIVIDNELPRRIKLTEKVNSLKFGGLSDENHSITICKSTESGIGYLEFAGIRCRALLASSNVQGRRIEFIGNSITCGMGSDLSVMGCDQGEWYDQHNAYMSYGPLTARTLNARWMLTAVSGIGLIHSCCDMTLTMPDVYDKINLRENKTSWNFSAYIPDIVSICLGQNDGIQDSTAFCGAYVSLIRTIRSKYPRADIICLTSPMADQKLSMAMRNYITSIVTYSHMNGDRSVHSFFFHDQYNSGCGSHPDVADHVEIAKELTAFMKDLKNW